MGWRPARSLSVLEGQINARFPHRSRITDGFIGDANHLITTSDHNPWYGPGIVTAGDFTHDPRTGFDIDRFTDELVASGDPRIKYIIANRLIFDFRRHFNPGWQWLPYFGSNPHTSHVHLSVVASPLCDSTTLWRIPMLGVGPIPPPIPAPPVPMVPAWPLVDRNHYFGLITGPERSHGGYYPYERPHVARIQHALQRKGFAPSNPAWADGKFEQPTHRAVEDWQRRHMPGTQYYGQVWWDDWAKLLAS